VLARLICKEMDMTKAILGGILTAVLLAGAAKAGEVDRRENREQARIDQGVKSGQLTPAETARLEKHQAKINSQIARDRAANGGKLTAAEKAKINREEDRQSRRIARMKHNNKTE